MNRRTFLSSSVLLAGCTRPVLDPDGDPVLPSGGDEIQRTLSESTARAYGLRHDEKPTFSDGMNLYERIVQLRGQPDAARQLAAIHEAAAEEVRQAIPRLATIIGGGAVDRLGYRHVRRLPAKGRYVVASDHHFTFRGHRTNFFARSGNIEVWANALGAYDDAGFTVIENGDVEDLVIFDPRWLPGEVAKRASMTLDELVARRQVVRLQQLRRIVEDPDNAPYVDAARRLAADGRLVRTAGNHDYDEQQDALFAVLEQAYPGVERPSDIVLLDQGGITRYAVMHGHQLDPATEPTTAPRIGETVSETLGLYYQGPDRVWRWNYDGVEGWATGATPFRNDLATARKRLDATAVDALEARHLDATHLDRDAHPSGAGNCKDVLRDLGQELFEALFKHDIAWEYFVHSDPALAVTDEVFSGDRWFKFRLLDEEAIASHLEASFPDPAVRPTLVLGHSHEVRFHSHRASGGTFGWYANTASAGRYENLIWAIEVVDGEATLVSWSRVHPPSGPVERRVWRHFEQDGAGFVQADEAPTTL